MAIAAELGLALIKGEQMFKGDADAFRAAVAPGQYAIDATVRIRGVMTVGEDTERCVAAAVPWQKLCGILLGKLNGVTLKSILEEALQGNGAVDALAKETDARAKEAVALLLGRTKQSVRGSVSVRCEVEEVAS